jgi:SAM-dependent methyltransferase
MAVVSSPGLRDTDADWREIGRSQPFWGVLTHPEFRRENLNPDSLAAFYATGVKFIASVAAELERISGAPFHVGTALDFGCGAGRLTEAMAAYAEQAFGYDISPGMLQEARARGAGKAIYTGELPETTYDWINSFIVFQHIPPERGFALLEQILSKLAPSGFISLHVTIYSDPIHHQAKPGWRASLGQIRQLLRPGRHAQPTGTVLMYEYDLNRLCELLHRMGITRMCLVHENHGGHHGVKIFGRREG